MDRHHPQEACPEGAAVLKRFDGRGVGGSGAAYSSSIGAGPAAEMVAADDCEWVVLRAAQRSAVADVAPGLPAGIDAGLTRWIGYYNTNRPHSALAGATPDEVYGQIQEPPYPGLAPTGLSQTMSR